MDFGKNNDGLNLYRINGSKAEIYKAIDDIKKLGCEIYNIVALEKAHKDWSVLIKVKIPEIKKKERLKKGK